MKIKLLKQPPLLLSLIFSSFISFSQTDTLYESKEEQVTYTIGEDKATVYSADIGLAKFHYYDPVDADDFKFRNIGNLGGAHFDFVFNPARNIGFNFGYNHFDLYRFTKNNVPYFDNPGLAHTHLIFLIGLNKEQTFHLTHNQNVGKRFKLGFYYK